METTLGLIGGEDEGGGAGELELGLGLSLTCSKGSTVAWGGDQYGRILTAKDFPNGFPTTITKRHAEVGSTVSGNAVSSQVVGWPPIGAHRMSSFVNQNQGKNSNVDENKKVDNEATEERLGHVIGFVKVNVDGLKIGRKVDLNAHSSYQSLAKSLEQMFFNSSSTSGEENNSSKQASKLLDGTSEFELTYEDKEGDWMLVGDVPWGMFLSTVKRLRIMRTSEATNGLAPRFQEGKDRQKGKRI